MKNGKVVNLFAPKDMHTEFLSAVGYGSMMGLLKNYEVINPFISSTIDSLNRLKPGFEAPVCIVTSLGLSRKYLPVTVPFWQLNPRYRQPDGNPY